MKFDAAIHKCVIVVDKALGLGHAANAISVIGVSFGGGDRRLGRSGSAQP